MKIRFADRSITTKLVVIQTLVILALMSAFIYYLAQRLTRITNNNQINELTKYNQMVIGMIEAYNESINYSTNNFEKIFSTYFSDQFELLPGTLVDVAGTPTPTLKSKDTILNLRYDEVDHIFANTGCVATIFVKSGNNFVRITTSLKKKNGERAIGTSLDPQHPAYPPLLAGQSYLGRAMLFGTHYMTKYAPIKSNGTVIGVLFIGMNFEKSLNTLKAKIKQITVGDTGYVYVLDADVNNKGLAILHPSKEGLPLWEFKDARGHFFIQEILRQKNGTIIYPWVNNEMGETKPRDKMVSFTYFPQWEWIVASGSYIEEFSKENKNLNFIMIVFGFLLIIFLVLLLGFICFHWVSNPLRHMTRMAEDLASGEADLTKRLEVNTKDEIGQLSGWINQFIQNIQDLVIQVQDASSDVVSATQEITEGSEEMASRSLAQAASINQTAGTLEKLTGSVKLNSTNANEVSQSLITFNNNIQARKDLINDVTQTMKEIDDSGKKIDGIINVINDISFQTNLLALNAAVEAARAGEAGRGFAVVAAEVRNLAQKTAESSKTIREIVSHNVESTNRGIQLVEETARFFQEIIKMMQTVVQRIQQITSASDEQYQGVQQIGEVITQLDQTLNQNTSIVEAFTATSQNMKENATHLQILVDNFKVNK